MFIKLYFLFFGSKNEQKSEEWLPKPIFYLDLIDLIILNWLHVVYPDSSVCFHPENERLVVLIKPNVCIMLLLLLLFVAALWLCRFVLDIKGRDEVILYIGAFSYAIHHVSFWRRLLLLLLFECDEDSALRGGGGTLVILFYTLNENDLIFVFLSFIFNRFYLDWLHFFNLRGEERGTVWFKLINTLGILIWFNKNKFKLCIRKQ